MGAPLPGEVSPRLPKFGTSVPRAGGSQKNYDEGEFNEH